MSGGLWRESFKIYPHTLPAPKSNETMLDWEWPSTGTIRFAAIYHEQDLQSWLGAQFAWLGFDQLEQWPEHMFWFLFSRLRSTCGVRPYCRATVNPDPDSWVAGFLSWWIDQETGFPIEERAGVLRYCLRLGEHLEWADRPADLEERWPALRAGQDIPEDEPMPPPISVTFIPARPDDNKELLKADPGYIGKLMALPPVKRAQLRYGNWKVREKAGTIFDRNDFGIVDWKDVPKGGTACRGWDFAATARQLKTQSGRRQRDPDRTAGVLEYRGPDGGYYILDMQEHLVGPGALKPLVLDMAERDRDTLRFLEAGYRVRWGIEPGASGLAFNDELKRALDGYDRDGIRDTADKLVRARPFADEVRAHNVSLVRGPWNERYLGQMHGQPDLPHDDIMDATSSSHAGLAEVVGNRGYRRGYAQQRGA